MQADRREDVADQAGQEGRAIDALAFRDCAAEPLPPPVFVQGPDPSSDGRFTLYWTQVVPQAVYTLEEAADADFLAASTVYEGPAARFDAPARKAGAVFYRLRARAGARRSAWSVRVRIEIGLLGHVTNAWHPAHLLEVHRQMLHCAAGLGRTGTAAACVLKTLGLEAGEALHGSPCRHGSLSVVSD